MVAPVPGSGFGSSTVSFSWTAGSGVTQYWLFVGTTVGGSDLYSQSTGTNLSATASGLPTTAPVYVRLWSLVGGVWQYTDYGYGPGAIQPTLRPS